MLAGVGNIAAFGAWAVGARPVQQLRRNYELFRGNPVKASEVRAGVRSYYRAILQQFALSSWSPEKIARSCIYPQANQTKQMLEQGPVVLALTHSGNWDLAGAWFCQEYAPIVTVAEKLDPPDLFEQFVEFRNSLGMEIIGVAKGEKVFDELVRKTEGKSVLVPLLADRDISGRGVEVQLGANKALVAAGPAALAKRLGRPLIAGHISYRKVKGRWVIEAHFTDPLPAPKGLDAGEDVESWTQTWVSAIEPVMRQYLEDWHMMQKVFIADLDVERLNRARQKVAEQGRES